MLIAVFYSFLMACLFSCGSKNYDQTDMYIEESYEASENCFLSDIFKEDNSLTAEIIASILVMNRKAEAKKDKNKTNEAGVLLTN